MGSLRGKFPSATKAYMETSIPKRGFLFSPPADFKGKALVARLKISLSLGFQCLDNFQRRDNICFLSILITPNSRELLEHIY